MKLFRSIKYLLSGIIILNILDGIFTSMHIHRWGIEVERNPLMNQFITEYGLVPFTLLKICIPIVVCTYVYFRYDEKASSAKLARIVMSSVFIFYIGITTLHVFNFSLYFFI